MLEYDELRKINAIIKTAYWGSFDKALHSDYDVLFNALQQIETMIEAQLKC